MTLPYVKIPVEKLISALTAANQTSAELPAAKNAGLTKLIEDVQAFGKILKEKDAEPFIYLSAFELAVLEVNGFTQENNGFRFESNRYRPALLVLELGTILRRILVPEMQEIYGLQFELTEDHAIRQKHFNEQPNQRLFRAAQRIMCWTRTGAWAAGHIEQNGVEILFIDPPKGVQPRSGGTYSRLDRKVRIYRENANKRLVASKIVHETDHHWRHKDFPELFSPNLDVVDQYVAMKLIELSAAATEWDHKERVKFYLLMFNHVNAEKIPETYTSKKYGRDLIECLDGNKLEKVVPDVNFVIAAQHEFTEIDWPYYERHFYHPSMIEVLRSGDFEQRVKTSPFLQSDFLRRFCVLPNGIPLPDDPQPFFDGLTQHIATLYQPVLARLAREGIARKNNSLPDRESVRDLQYPQNGIVIHHG